MIKYFTTNVTVHDISDVIVIERKGKGVPDLVKKVLTLETEDGQIFYPELRNKKISLLDSERISLGDRIQVEFSLWGSEKNGKRYNNIYLNSIKKLC